MVALDNPHKPWVVFFIPHIEPKPPGEANFSQLKLSLENGFALTHTTIWGLSLVKL